MIQLITQIKVFNTPVDTGIVIDFNDKAFAVFFFNIDTI